MDVHDEFVPEETFAEFVARMPQVCVEVALVRDGSVLLAHRTNRPVSGEWFWPGSRLYKGERLPEAARRVASEELGVEVEVLDRFGVYEHLWEESAPEGSPSRHTVNVVFRVRQTDDAPVTLDDQHDDYRFVDGPEPWMHEYVRAYLEDGLLDGV